MGEFLWLDTADGRWGRLLDRAAARDAYHLPGYHALAEERGEGEARLAAYLEDDGEGFAALPLLLRPVPDAADGLRDATSVYGYAGPFASASPLPPGTARRFREALGRELEARGVVAVFARLHPLMEQAPLLEGLGEVRASGTTVSIDLALPPELQTARYSSNHRRNLDRLRKSGYASHVDHGFEHLDAFVEIYHENMSRVGASGYYFFDRAYFAGLRARLGGRLSLIVCRHSGGGGGEVAGGALFFEEGGIVQYHLGAVATAHLPMAPLKQLLDEARRAFAARGASVLHLGGGRGGAEDSLFRFKAGFSDRRHAFATWRWVVRPEAYERLCAAQRAAGGPEPPAGFFPAYRA
jgi:hypothetical protein